MFQVCAFYRPPSDPAAFDSRDATVHRDILGRLPGLKHATINWPRAASDTEPAPFHLVTVMYWDDRESALAALASPAGRQAAADAQQFPHADSFTTFATSHEMVPFTRFAAGTEICGVLGLYGKPKDERAFRDHYETTHGVLAAKMPRQAAFTVSWTMPGPDGSVPPYHLIGNQQWKSQDDFEFCLGSPEAEAAIADLDNFAGGEMTMLSCRTVVVI